MICNKCKKEIITAWRCPNCNHDLSFQRYPNLTLFALGVFCMFLFWIPILGIFCFLGGIILIIASIGKKLLSLIGIK